MAKNIPTYASKKQLSMGGGVSTIRPAGLLSSSSNQVSINSGRVSNFLRLNPGPQIQSRQYNPPYKIDPKTGHMIADLADSVYEAAIKIQDKIDSQVAKDKYYDLRARTRALFYGDDSNPDDVGYSGQHGTKAIAGHTAYVSAVQGIYKDNLKDLSYNQKQKYLALAQPFVDSAMQKAAEVKQRGVVEKDNEQMSVAFSDARDSLQHDPASILNPQNGMPSVLSQLRTKMTALYGSTKTNIAIDSMLTGAIMAKSVNTSGEAAKALYSVLNPYMADDVSRAKAKLIYERKIKLDKLEVERQHDEQVTKKLETITAGYISQIDRGSSYSLIDYYKAYYKIDPEHATSRAVQIFNLQNNIAKSKELKSGGSFYQLMENNIVNKRMVAKDLFSYIEYATPKDGVPAKITTQDAAHLIQLARMIKTQGGHEAVSFYRGSLAEAKKYYDNLDQTSLGVAKVQSIWNSGKLTKGGILYKQFKNAMNEALYKNKDDPQAQMNALNQVYTEFGKGKFATQSGELSHPVNIISNSFIFPVKNMSREELESAETGTSAPDYPQYDMESVDKADTMIDRLWNNQKAAVAAIPVDFVAPQYVRMPTIEYGYGAKLKSTPTEYKWIDIDFAPYSKVVSKPNELAWWFQQAVKNKITGAVPEEKIIKAKNAMLSYLRNSGLIAVNDNDGFYWSDALDTYRFRTPDGDLKSFTPTAKFFKKYLGY